MDSIITGLHFYWYETKPHEELHARRGELARAVIRLQFASDELTLTTDEPDIETMLARVAYHVENYWVRAYELQERAVTLVAALYGGSKNARKQLANDLHQKGKRQPAFDKILQRIPRLVKPLDQLLKALDHDIEIRTRQTHNQFLLLGAGLTVFSFQTMHYWT